MSSYIIHSGDDVMGVENLCSQERFAGFAYSLVPEAATTGKLNGRQIRNAIATARQYAKWKREVLTYHHLKDVIEVSARFDDYSENIYRGGLMQD
ncbi:hypothetical protein N7501_001559 [Penicillium viridicatum]|nr:hypothetical protein N7501_001559 [Penicillium viridicatum]